MLGALLLSYGHRLESAVRLDGASDTQLEDEERRLLAQSMWLHERAPLLLNESERFRVGPEADREQYMQLHDAYMRLHAEYMQVHKEFMAVYNELRRRGK